jgi:hypothetical protein
VAALALCLALAACATPLDRAYGVAQRAHVAQSIANPDAGVHDLEARRPDGTTTGSALNRYRTREAQVERPEPPPVININAR